MPEYSESASGARSLGSLEEPYLSHPVGTRDRRASSWMSRISLVEAVDLGLCLLQFPYRVVSVLLDFAPLNRVVAGRKLSPESVDSILQGDRHQLASPLVVTR